MRRTAIGVASSLALAALVLYPAPPGGLLQSRRLAQRQLDPHRSPPVEEEEKQHEQQEVNAQQNHEQGDKGGRGEKEADGSRALEWLDWLGGRAAEQCHGHSKDTGTFEALAEVHRLPPFYFIAMSLFIKPVVSTLLFGPPVPKQPDDSLLGRAKGAAKQGLQLAFLGMFAATALADFVKMRRALQAEEASAWERTLAAAIIASSSTNIQAGFNAFGLYLLSLNSLQWAHSHGCLKGITVGEHLGWIGILYTRTAMVTYLLLAVILIIFAAPAIIAYCYAALALLLINGSAWVSFVFVFIPFVLPWARQSNAGHSMLGEAEATTAEDAAQHLEAMEYTYLSKPLEEYARQVKAYTQTGAPAQAWNTYAMNSMLFSPFVAVFIPVAARLYAGRGYWAALASTMQERHLSSYMGCAASSAMAKVGVVWLWL
mmetsp:Transcript_82839/g.215813  ORF Transcript_82839/g.215813 Transcript_82839/m.215813 type:complete len:429 (-) Transcript_82839:88-1374(-)